MNDETLFLFLNNELSTKENEIVEAWIEKNPEHFEKLKLIWENSSIDQAAIKPDMENMWDKISSEIDSSEKNRKTLKAPRFKTLFKYAAIFMLGLGISGYIAYQRINHIEWIEYISNNNNLEDILLPDGSTVALNKASTLFYKKQFLADTREVKLIGEAFFQVKRNPNKPLIVNVNDAVVKVLGTSFNIDATDSLGHILVTVNSGRVMFHQKADTSNCVYLLKGDRGVFSSYEQTIIKSENEDENYLAWKTGILLFKNNTLPEVCEVLNKYYDTNIIIDQPDLVEKQLTARYDNLPLSEVLELLHLALDIQYIKKDDSIRLGVNHKSILN